MSDINPEALAEAALRKLNEGDPREARKLLMQAVEAAPDRPDLLNALGVVQLQLGESHLALPLIEEALRRVGEQIVAHLPFVDNPTLQRLRARNGSSGGPQRRALIHVTRMVIPFKLRLDGRIPYGLIAASPLPFSGRSGRFCGVPHRVS